MKDFLKKIVSAILENSENFEIKEEEENGIASFTILVPEIEVGKIIGKEGRTINAIRCLSRLKASQNQQRVQVKVDKLV